MWIFLQHFCWYLQLFRCPLYCGPVKNFFITYRRWDSCHRVTFQINRYLTLKKIFIYYISFFSYYLRKWVFRARRLFRGKCTYILQDKESRVVSHQFIESGVLILMYLLFTKTNTILPLPQRYNRAKAQRRKKIWNSYLSPFWEHGIHPVSLFPLLFARLLCLRGKHWWP